MGILLFFFAVFLLYFILANERHEGIRERIMLVIVGMGLWISLSTELLNALGAINRFSIMASWIGIDLVLAAIFYWRCKDLRAFFSFRLPNIKNFYRQNKIGVLGAGGILVILFFTALYGYPNTSDGFTYHMTRIMHWLQNESLSHYPTHIPRQLYMPPFAEMVFLHIKSLYGGDGLLNLVPWIAIIACGIGVSKIVKEFGGTPFLQIFAFVLVVTLPEGIMKATSVKNDLILSFFLVSLAYFIIKSLKKAEKASAFKIGVVLGLAILVKGTGYLYALPIMIWWGMAHLWKWRLKFWRPLLTVILAVLILNAGHYVRNFNLYDSPVAVESSARKDYSNDLINLKAFVSNVVRNVTNHLGTPSKRVNKAIEKGVKDFHHWLGIDANDPRTTFEEHEYHVERISNNAALAQNFIHLMLIFLGIIIFVIQGFPKQYGRMGLYGLCVLGAFVLFALLLKWQISHTRLLTPLFILWVPFLAFTFSRSFSQKWIGLIAVILLIGAIPWTLYNFNRPFLVSIDEWERRESGAIEVEFDNVFTRTKKDKYFNIKPYIQPYKEVGKQIKNTNCKDIGLVGDRTTLEYLLWVVLDNHQFQRKYTIRHQFVENASKATEAYPEFTPCVYIVHKNANASKKATLFSGSLAQEFDQFFENKHYRLFKRNKDAH